MSLEELRQKQTNLLLQRAAAKDQLEALERALQQITFAVQVLEKQPKDEPTED